MTSQAAGAGEEAAGSEFELRNAASSRSSVRDCIDSRAGVPVERDHAFA